MAAVNPCAHGAIAGGERRRGAGDDSNEGKGFVCSPETLVDDGPLLSSKDVDGMGDGNRRRATSSLSMKIRFPWLTWCRAASETIWDVLIESTFNDSLNDSCQ